MSGDGGLSDVKLRGDTVDRRAGEWTPTVHALLRHLPAAGFAAVPRPLGIADGREVLAFVPGGEATHSDDELVRVAELIRAFHEATRSFVAPADARWQFMVGAPREGDVICHNDLAPDNVIYEPVGVPCALIDWDLAAPDRVRDRHVAAPRVPKLVALHVCSLDRERRLCKRTLVAPSPARRRARACGASAREGAVRC